MELESREGQQRDGPVSPQTEPTHPTRPLPTPLSDATSLEPGITRIGRFTVLQQIGRGGMGTVYSAYDEQLDRKVAVKVLFQREVFGERQRLLREAQSLARLSHPNVVTVFEIGESDGRLFLAMEYVRGLTLDRWLTTLPDWEDVLEVFARAGQGLAAAHEAGLVHRDFKPGNVIRTEDGVVKVLDFGLARTNVGNDTPTADALDRELEAPSSLSVSLTQTGTVLGTPAFMAPEQHHGDPCNAAADQYSFCVALWQGLTGTRPFKGTTSEALCRAKLAGAPAWPHDAPVIPRRIVEAIRRGLDPAPDLRWPTLRELLAALAWDPKRRRHRWWLALAGAGLLGVSLVAGQLDKPRAVDRCASAPQRLAGVWDRSRAAQVQEAFAAVNEAYAGHMWNRTQAKLETYSAKWVAMNADSCNATVRGEQSSRVQDLRIACLQRASRKLEATVDTLVNADAAVVRQAHQLVDELPALASCADIVALEAEVDPPRPQDAQAVERARRHLAHASSARSAGRMQQAFEAVESAFDILSQVTYEPAQTELEVERARVAIRRGRFEQAEAFLLRATELASKWGQDGLQAEALCELIYTVGVAQNRMDEAEMLRPIVLGLTSGFPSRAARAHSVLGMLRYHQGRYEESESEFRTAVALQSKLLGSDHLAVAVARANLTNVLNIQGKMAEAVVESRAVLAAMQSALGPSHPKVAEAHEGLGKALMGPETSKEKLEEAERELRLALKTQEATVGPKHPDVARVRMNLGFALTRLNRFKEAEATFRTALTMREELLRPGHADIAMARHNLAEALARQGRYAEAEAEFRTAIATKTEGLGRHHPSVAASQRGLAHALFNQRRYAEAEAQYRAALASYVAGFGPEHSHTTELERELAELLLKLEQPTEALALAEQAWTWSQTSSVAAGSKAAAAFLLARVLWSVEPPQRDRARARDLAHHALELLVDTDKTFSTQATQLRRWIQAHA